MSKTVLTTVVVGHRYQTLFNEFCLESWKTYAKIHDYDLRIFDRPLKPLPGKSPSWQKLYIPQQRELFKYDQIVFVDSDIIIKNNAPSIVEFCPLGKISFVREIPFTGSEADWYSQFDLSPQRYIVQAGVLCMSPEHKSIFAEAEDFPETEMFEMPALSHIVSQTDLGHFIDPRFNALVGTLLLNKLPSWLVKTKVLKEAAWKLMYPPLRRAIQEICDQAWFLHAAGAKRDLNKIQWAIAKTKERNR